MRIRNYTELSKLTSFQDRLEYLKLDGAVGISTFGFDRYLNQKFYSSSEWRRVRNFVIMRDRSCDLGVDGYDVMNGLLIHHMNPILEKDITDRNENILDPEFLITTTHNTHNNIHYSVDRGYPEVVVERTPNDTRLW